MSNKLKAFGFDSIDDFEVALSTAIHNASTVWEKNFTNDLHTRYLEYGFEKLNLSIAMVRKLAELQVGFLDRKPI